MSILRNPNRERFTVISNDAPEDARLSAEGLGLYTYLMSKPDGWRILPKELRKRFGVGRDKIQGIFKHLTLLGYLELRRIYEGGKLAGTEYILHEIPREPENPALCPENLKTQSLGKTRDSGNAGPLVNTETTARTETESNLSEADASPTPEDLFPDAQSAVDEVVQAYNEILAPLGCPKVKRVNEQRKRLVARALKISKKHRDPKWWRTKFFPHVAETTRLTKGNGKYGPMGFDHMMRPDVVTRIEEGYYFADSKRD